MTMSIILATIKYKIKMWKWNNLFIFASQLIHANFDFSINIEV